MSDQKTNADKLTDMLKFDAGKRQTLTQDVFADVVKEINEERVKVVKTQAKEQLVKAMGLREQMTKAKKEFESQHKKMEKELGKILNQIQGILSGKEETEEEDSKEPSAAN
jgi:hypothetical protein